MHINDLKRINELSRELGDLTAKIAEIEGASEATAYLLSLFEPGPEGFQNVLELNSEKDGQLISCSELLAIYLAELRRRRNFVCAELLQLGVRTDAEIIPAAPAAVAG